MNNSTSPQPLQISDEALECAFDEFQEIEQRSQRASGTHPVGYHTQLAINSATEKLREENIKLREQVDRLSKPRTVSLEEAESLARKKNGAPFFQEEINSLQQQLLQSQQLVMELRKVLVHFKEQRDAIQLGVPDEVTKALSLTLPIATKFKQE